MANHHLIIKSSMWAKDPEGKQYDIEVKPTLIISVWTMHHRDAEQDFESCIGFKSKVKRDPIDY